ncbi:MAG: phosphopantetheine-binding protein, partial [Planctomycetota bacterium]
RLAFCGAEPIHAATLTSFAEAFETAGFRPHSFYPCYGLAESTLLAAGPDSTEPPTILAADRAELGAGRAKVATDDSAAQQLVGCGRAPAGHELLVVDPDTLQPQPDRTVGEIVVAGPSVAHGYWRREEETAAAFGVSIGDSDHAWLRTGDLGFVYEGELFVTGRLKDVIIVRGRNYYPQDLEKTAELADADVLPGAAFSCEIDDEERLVLVCQIDRSCRQDARPAVVDAIRRAVLAEHEVDPYAVVLIRQGSLPVTSSGKVQRSLCRERYLAGELKVLHQWTTSVGRRDANRPAIEAPPLDGLSLAAATERIEEWMLHWLVERTDVDTSQIDRQRPFAEQGLDSLTAVELSGELEEAFAVELPPIVAWNYPTPAALAGYLAEQKLGAGEPAAAPAMDDPAAADLEALLASVEDLSDEEAQRLLAEEE